MLIPKITKKIEFSAGHRLLNYIGKCNSPHGHEYLAEITISASRGYNKNSMVIDFGDVKEHVKSWIDLKWDHGFLLNSNDTSLIESLKSAPYTCPDYPKLYIFDNVNPTAEMMARELYEKVVHPIFSGIDKDRLVAAYSVTIWETPSSCATYGEA